MRRGREDATLFQNSPPPGRDRETCRGTIVPALRRAEASPDCGQSRERENPCPVRGNRAATGAARPEIWNRLPAPLCPHSRPCAIPPCPRKEWRAVAVRWPAANAKVDKSIGPFPGGIGVDEQDIGHDRTKSAEHGDEC